MHKLQGWGPKTHRVKYLTYNKATVYMNICKIKALPFPVLFSAQAFIAFGGNASHIFRPIPQV
jgi:hypothetical protein